MATENLTIHFSFEYMTHLTYREVVQKKLTETFGTSSLNRDQFAAIMSIMDGRYDVTISATAGSSRSICYLIPALIRSPKVTLVFCPSVRQIEGRVRRLQELKIPITTIHSEMQMEDQIKAVDNFILNYQKAVLIYMTPDQVFCKHFKKLVDFLQAKNALAYLVLDESCNEHPWQTGDENVYCALSKIRSPQLKWILLTVSDHCDALIRLTKILDLKTFDANFITNYELYCRDRIYDVIIYNNPEISNMSLKKFISETLGSRSLMENRPRGLIFCRTGKMAEQIATDLQKIGVSIDPYHPGLERHKKDWTFNQFYTGELQLLAVTSSSAKHIKSSYIRLIIHWGLPSSIPDYYEESGLARLFNGVLARCRIYVTNSALSYYNEERESDLKSYLNNDSGETPNLNAKMRFGLYMRTSLMKDYCVYKNCRHEFLIRYFQKKILYCEDRCDNCKSQINKFKSTRIQIRREIESVGVSNFIKEFGNKVKQQLFVENDKEAPIRAMRTYEELLKLIVERSFGVVSLMESNKETKLLQMLFEELYPIYARQVHQCGNNVIFKYYSIRSSLTD